MKQLLFIFSTIIISLITSCTSSNNQQLSEDEIWKLGWRINENLIYENYEIASLQFDSLLSLDIAIESTHLSAGLEAKTKLGKMGEVIEILNEQPMETLNEICQHGFAAKLKSCENISSETPTNEILQIELITMYIKDQASRGNIMTEIMSKYNIDKSQLEYEVGVDIDEANRNRLKEIINEYGFPNKKLVGNDAMNGVFYIIQHSNGDKEWQKSQLENIEKSVKSGDMDGQKYAYLYDRIKTNTKEKQLYGTQFSKVDPTNNIVQLFETADPANLDNRRKEIGMMPIEMYKRIMLKVSTD